MDRKKEQIERYQYDFTAGDLDDRRPRPREPIAICPAATAAATGEIVSDHTPEEYMANVETVREGMRSGDYYEVVLRQTFSAPYSRQCLATCSSACRQASPSPYEFLLQFGDEQLVGASPEMFVRVEGARVETCPISGTAQRTGDPLRTPTTFAICSVRTKEESELTMCTDVDRNDKSRVCEPGSVKVIGRRLIESYAGVFHTVDHVEGTLQPGFDSLDAFLSHMWAVTVDRRAEESGGADDRGSREDARGWYGGAVGMLSLNGDINTGILIRTIHLRDGMARVSGGRDAAVRLRSRDGGARDAPQGDRLLPRACGLRRSRDATEAANDAPARGPKMLLVDNDDCFIHTLANYARQTGAEVVTYRAGFPLELIDEIRPDLILISPGPGGPRISACPIWCAQRPSAAIPVFGVCLGCRGSSRRSAANSACWIIRCTASPRPCAITARASSKGLPEQFQVGRYHSLFAIRSKFPAAWKSRRRRRTASSWAFGIASCPIEAVQFHPESLLEPRRWMRPAVDAQRCGDYGRARALAKP